MTDDAIVSKADPLWSRRCRAYMVKASLDDECRARLAAVQVRLRGVVDGIAVCPPATLHVTLAHLLSVGSDYGLSKDELWEQRGERWCDELRLLADRLRTFDLHFNAVRVSGTAVIARAGSVAEVDELRRLATSLQRQTGLAAFQPSIVHCTLLRYVASGVPLTDLFRAAGRIRLRVCTTVTEIEISKELVYPSLESEALARLRLRGPRLEGAC